MGPNTAKIRCVDRPVEEPVLVSLDRLRKCPPEIGGEFWPPDKKSKKSSRNATSREKDIDMGGTSSHEGSSGESGEVGRGVAIASSGMEGTTDMPGLDTPFTDIEETPLG